MLALNHPSRLQFPLWHATDTCRAEIRVAGLDTAEAAEVVKAGLKKRKERSLVSQASRSESSRVVV
jgi:hypothetical protein